VEADRRANAGWHPYFVAVELVVYPAIDEIWKWRFELKRSPAERASEGAG
jgi:hypothetical protein